MPRVGIYLFLLGLACGITVLTTLGYRRVSPRWLRGLLMVSGLFVMSGYIAMALFAGAQTETRWLLFDDRLFYCWFTSFIGLMLPSVFAIDQLLRHPAMTPKKLLGWFSPFLAVYSLVSLLGIVKTPRAWGNQQLSPAWYLSFLVIHVVFIVGFVGVSVFLMRKVPSRPIRLALLGLIVGQGYLGFDGLRLLFAYTSRFAADMYPPDVASFLYSPVVILLALWHAYETSARLQ